MPAIKITPDEVDFIMKMKKVKYSNCEIARKLGVTEGTIRYRIKRKLSGKEDGRKKRGSALDRYNSVLKKWEEEYRDAHHRPAMKVLYKRLQQEYGYKGSYDAFRRYIRKHLPEFHRKEMRMRIETPPGALMLVDWKEDIHVQMGHYGNWVKLQGFCFTLGFSRKMVVQFCERKDLESFIQCHQRGFREIGGLPEVVRTDCLKSAVHRWKGRNSVLNERYERYMKGLGIEVFPSRPGMPQDKGKVEKRIRDLFSQMDFRNQVFSDMADLHKKVNEELGRLESQWFSGATGMSVEESFRYERDYLKALPNHFPTIPLNEKRTRVRMDGTVFFEGNYYQVSGEYRGQAVLCENTGEEILIYHGGEEIGRFAYLPGAKGMVRVSAEAIHKADVHLSDIVRRWALEVASRQVDIYHEIIGRQAG